MTKEYAIRRLKVLTDYEYDVDLEALEMAIKALKQQPCEDCISRQAAIDELELQAKEMSQWSERYTEQAKGVPYCRGERSPPYHPDIGGRKA